MASALIGTDTSLFKPSQSSQLRTVVAGFDDDFNVVAEGASCGGGGGITKSSSSSLSSTSIANSYSYRLIASERFEASLSLPPDWQGLVALFRNCAGCTRATDPNTRLLSRICTDERKDAIVSNSNKERTASQQMMANLLWTSGPCNASMSQCSLPRPTSSASRPAADEHKS